MKNVLIRPHLTEKTLVLASSGWYTFRVDRKASKGQIKKQIEEMYKVSVIRVRTISMHGKTRRIGKKLKNIKMPDWKKAMVKLKKGQTIEAFEVTEESNKKKK